MRRAIRGAIWPAFTILLVVCAISCTPRSAKTDFSPALVDAQGRPSLGYLEHRGEMHDLRDWSSSVYDPIDRNNIFTHRFLGPTIADDGSGFYMVIATSRIIDEQVLMFGFEDPVEGQCIEISDIEGPMLPSLLLTIPE